MSDQPGDSMSYPGPPYPSWVCPLFLGVGVKLSSHIADVCLVEWKYSGPQTTVSWGTVFTDPDRRKFQKVLMCSKGAGAPGSPSCQDLRHWKQIRYLTWARNWAFVKEAYRKRKGFPRVVDYRFNSPLFRGLQIAPLVGEGKNVVCASPTFASACLGTAGGRACAEGVGCQGAGGWVRHNYL